ncbi:MAG: holo-ACP synthase [Actinomycetota bacterium]|nr:holo-ACP synthase [Actinomycetota bacterium]
MSITVGTDILEINRFRKVLERRPGLRRKIFTEAEVAYCESKADSIPHFAARFCAKEAFSKAIGSGVRAFSMSEVEVVRNDLGKPGIELSGRAQKIASDLAVKDVDVSMSHSDLFAVAVVVVEK